MGFYKKWYRRRLDSVVNDMTKVKKAFNWDEYNERQVALRVAYVGWGLAGFVLQKDTKDTVEEHLFSALERARLIRDRGDCHYSLCGRTDAGVSGIGNVVSVRVRSVCPVGIGIQEKEGAITKTEELNYAQILNGILPSTIRIVEQAYVPLEFNARFDCKTRGYRYFFHLFDKDVEKMREAAAMLIGEHDYRNFCKFSPENAKHCVRRIDKVEFGDAGGGVWYFEIVGSGFIWHQIRCIATVLFAVGDGLEEPSVVQELLDIVKYPGRPQYPIAEPEPLVFWRAEYDNVEWQKPQDALAEKIKKNFGQMLKDMEMRAAVLRCFTEGPPVPPQRKSYTPIAKLQVGRSVEEILAEWEESHK